MARKTSLVGSIGVLFQYPNVSELLKTVGVKVEEVKSSPLKAAPNGFEPTSPEARAAIEAKVVAVAVVNRAPTGMGQRMASNASLRRRMKRASTMARVTSRGVP